MNPSAITELTTSAKNLTDTKRKGSPEAFILAWIAWEGSKLRMLAVAQKKQGIKIKETYASHKDKSLWNEKIFEKEWKRVFGEYPASMRGMPGKIFKKINSYKKYRDKLVHGKSFGNPNNVHDATLEILRVLEDKKWLDEILIVTKMGTLKMSDHFYRVNRKN